MTPPRMNWRSSRVLLHGETEKAGRDRYWFYLQDSLKCIHPTAIFYSSKRPITGGAEEMVMTTSPDSIELQVSGGGVLYLSAAQSFRMRRHKGEWKASTLEYIYNVGERPDARDYMFAWHWHPNQPPDWCHLHVAAELSNQMRLDRKHLPTARVSFEEVLWFLIDEFEVVSAVPPDECKTRLEENRARHEKHRSWRGSRKP